MSWVLPHWQETFYLGPFLIIESYYLINNKPKKAVMF